MALITTLSVVSETEIVFYLCALSIQERVCDETFPISPLARMPRPLIIASKSQDLFWNDRLRSTLVCNWFKSELNYFAFRKIFSDIRLCVWLLVVVKRGWMKSKTCNLRRIGWKHARHDWITGISYLISPDCKNEIFISRKSFKRPGNRAPHPL